MIKVLIADDEPKIRIGLSKCIPWEANGMEICALAFDGEDALEKVKEYQPDICLVDICMPLLSGLDFIEELHKINKDCICIVITGHDEFSYAQRSVRIGVFEYILKPVDEEELLKTVLRAKKEIELVKDNLAKTKQAETFLVQNHSILKEQFLHQLLKTNMALEEIKRQEKVFDLGKTKSMYLFLIPGRREESFVKKDGKNTLKYSIKAIVERFAKDFGKCDAFWDEEENIVLLLRLESEKLPAGFIEELDNHLAVLRGYSVDIKYEMIYGLDEIFGTYNKWKEDKGGYSSELIKKIRHYVEQHFSEEELSVQMIGEVFHVNTSYLSRVFKQETGINLAEYISKIRVEEAEYLLGATDLKIYEIAKKTGYKSQHYFCVAFKKYCDVSPTEYRNTLRKRGGI